MKKIVFLISVFIVLITTSCTKNYVLVGNDNVHYQTITIGEIIQTAFGENPEFKITYHDNSFPGGSVVGKVFTPGGVNIRQTGELIFLNESGQLSIGGWVFSRLDEGNYNLVLENIRNDNENNYRFKRDGDEEIYEKIIIPFTLTQATNGTISVVQLSSFNVMNGNNTFQQISKLDIEVENGPVHIERIDWVINVSGEDIDDTFENVKILDENGNIVTQNNHLDDLSEWRRMSGGYYLLRLHTSFVLNPGMHHLYIKTINTIGGNHNAYCVHDFELRHMDLRGITSTIQSNQSGFSIH